jgi:DNA-binding NarL/FixJ family response regulator/class 3 adenylate cyclase
MSTRPEEEHSTNAVRIFLIGDVRGYTSFTETRGDHAAGRLATRFSEIARASIQAGGGTVISFRGDEVLAEFASARAAMDAAVALQRNLADATFEDDSLPLPTGIGLDAGEAVAVDDGYRGGAINLAARLCSLARAGEILATREVAHLAGAVHGIAYEDRGTLNVKNLSRSVAVVRVVPEGDDPAERFASLGRDPHFEAPPRLRVTVADDSVLVREVLVRILAEAGCEVTGQCGDGDELLALVERDPPDIVITDIRMPPTHSDEGLVAALRIRSDFPSVGVLVLSQYVEARHAMELIGESPERVGYLLKDRVLSVGELADSVHRLAAGAVVVDPEVIGTLLRRRRDRDRIETLSDPERHVLALMAEGRTDDAIAERLAFAREEVERLVANIFEKLGLDAAGDDHRRVLAVLAYMRS